MRRMPWTTYLWPGLPQLWFWGLGSGLVLAVGFAALLNLLLLASFVWVELLSPGHLRLGWGAIATLWAGSTVISAWNGGQLSVPRGATSAEVLFREALGEYLQGSWFEAETILTRLLQLYPRDVEGRLLLATMLRRTRRHAEALEQLDRLERLRDAERWALEIAAERRWVLDEQSRPAEEPAPASDAPAPATDSPAQAA